MQYHWEMITLRVIITTKNDNSSHFLTNVPPPLFLILNPQELLGRYEWMWKAIKYESFIKLSRRTGLGSLSQANTQSTCEQFDTCFLILLSHLCIKNNCGIWLKLWAKVWGVICWFQERKKWEKWGFFFFCFIESDSVGDAMKAIKMISGELWQWLAARKGVAM